MVITVHGSRAIQLRCPSLILGSSMRIEHTNSVGRRYQYVPTRHPRRRDQEHELDLTSVTSGPYSRRSNGLLLSTIAAFCLFGFLLASQGIFSSDQWWAVYYPQIDDRTKYIDLGRHVSLEQCRAAVTDHIHTAGVLLGEYDYQCGLNCNSLTEELNRFICESNQR